MNESNSNNKAVQQKPEGFIGKTEVARRIGKTVRTVDSWMKRGILPFYKPDRSVLFRWDDVENHIVRNYQVDPSGNQRGKPSLTKLPGGREPGS